MLLLLAFALTGPPPPPSSIESNTHFSCSVRTTAPPACIWAIWTNVDHWPEWDKGLKQATLAGPWAVGTRGELVPDKGPRSAFELTAVEPGRSYTFRTKLPLGALYVRRTLSQADGQTQFTHEVWFTGASKGLFGRVLGRRYRALLPEVLAAIRRQAER